MSSYYSKVRIFFRDNTIFITDTKDGDCIVVRPEAWEHIKENVDQQIADGYLEDVDE